MKWCAVSDLLWFLLNFCLTLLFLFQILWTARKSTSTYFNIGDYYKSYPKLQKELTTLLHEITPVRKAFVEEILHHMLLLEDRIKIEEGEGDSWPGVLGDLRDQLFCHHALVPEKRFLVCWRPESPCILTLSITVCCCHAKVCPYTVKIFFSLSTNMKWGKSCKVWYIHYRQTASLILITTLFCFFFLLELHHFRFFGMFKCV